MKLPHRRQFLHLAAGAAALPAVSRHRFGARLSVPSGALDRLFCGGHPNDIVARIIVEPLRKGGYGFNIKTNPYSWLTLHYETKEAVEEGLIDALRATEKTTLK